MTSHEKEILKKKFGATIQQLRKNKRLTLRQVAAACQLDNSKIAKIEKGMINITFTTLLQLAMALEKHPSALLEYEPE